MLSVPYLTASILAKLEDIELEKKQFCPPTGWHSHWAATVFYSIGSGFVLHSVSKYNGCQYLFWKTILFQDMYCNYLQLQHLLPQYSRASRYTASSCTDLDNARFWIESKKTWDARIYVVSTFRCTNFWAALFFLSYTNSPAYIE